VSPTQGLELNQTSMKLLLTNRNKLFFKKKPPSLASSIL
jgi:hypothetical protein